MEITGRIIAALEPRSGVSQRTGNKWVTQSFVLETHDQYPRRCVFDVFGEDKLHEMNIQVGQELTVSFDIDAREYQGRWFNSIRAWRVMPAAQAVANPTEGVVPPVATYQAPAQQQPAMPAQAPVATPQPASEEHSDLPF